MRKMLANSPMAPGLILLVLAGAGLLVFDRLKEPAQPEKTREIFSPVAVRPAPEPVPPHGSDERAPTETSPAAPEPMAQAATGNPPTPPEKPEAHAQPRSEERRHAELPPARSISPQDARAALGLVGADADAEKVWATAINDPNMSAHDRKDLIEDLNETGFADPKHLTADDLPLIVNRLKLIENMAPNAMDDVNAAAFAEAYKDLTHMYQRLAGN